MPKSQKKPYNPFNELAEIRQEKRSNLSGTQESGRLDTSEPKRPSAKSQNADYVKLTAYVPKELHRAAKARLVQQGREVSELVEELVSDWLKRQ